MNLMNDGTQIATWSKLTGAVRIHTKGCKAARETKVIVLCDAEAVRDLEERGYQVKTCACTK